MSAREEFVRQARLVLARVNTLPREQRDEAWTDVYGRGALRHLAGLTEFSSQNWLESPSNRTTKLEYLKRNPANTIGELNIQYILEVQGGQLLLERAGVKGGDESNFRVRALLKGSDLNTQLFWFRMKKTQIAGTSKKRISNGRRSSPGTGKTRIIGPQVGAVVTFQGQGDNPDVKMRILNYNLKRGVMYTRKTSK